MEPPDSAAYSPLRRVAHLEWRQRTADYAASDVTPSRSLAWLFPCINGALVAAEHFSTSAHERAPGRDAHFIRALPVPRSGFATRMLRAVVRGYGEHASTRALKLAADAAEAYNDWLFHALSDARQKVWLERDLRRLLRSFRSADEAERARCERVFDRIAGGADDTADRPIVEGVAFTRTLIAASVLIGDLNDELHAALDRFAVGVGVLWEICHGPLDAETARCAFGHIGVAIDANSDLVTVATTLARDALEALPASTETEELSRLVDEARWAVVVGGARRARRFSRCEPTLGAPRVLREGPAFAKLFRELGAPVLNDTLARAVEREIDTVVAAESPSLRAALHYLRHQGGKRLRLTLTLLAAEAAGGDPKRAVRAACLVEWLHQSSLVLDDMLDEAPRRRGVETLHTATTAPYSALVVAFILRSLGRAAEPEHEAVRRCLLDAAVTLADGERLELGANERKTLDRTDYMRIIEAKTARLFSCSAMIGALACKADKNAVRALGAFGKQAGIAFQIVDDTLDYAGNEKDLGKLPGTDHGARKVTLPVLLLADTLCLDPRAVLDRPFADVRDRMTECGVPHACLEVARHHLTIARTKLAPLPHPEALLRFAERLVERRA